MSETMFKAILRLAIAAIFAFAAVLPAAAAYRIKAGDTLKMQVLEDSSLNSDLLVLPDGSVTVPSVGTIRAAGDSIETLRNLIAQRLTPNFATKPTVYLSVGSLAPVRLGVARGAMIDVYAMGEVAKPGMVEVKRGTTLLQALAASGGPTPYAATKRIQLRRSFKNGQSQILHFDYKALMSGDAVPTIVLQPGDVIMVPTRRLFE
jgi:polysaccharide export outer membrane protein